MPGAAAAGMPGLVAGYLLKTTVVLTLALAAAAIARRRPAALRHFLLSSALVGLLLLPCLSLAPVGWRSTLVPRWMAPAAESDQSPKMGKDLDVSRPSPVAEAPAEAWNVSGRPVETALPGTTSARGGVPIRIQESRPDRTIGTSLAAGRAEASSNPAVKSAATELKSEV